MDITFGLCQVPDQNSSRILNIDLSMHVLYIILRKLKPEITLLLLQCWVNYSKSTFFKLIFLNYKLVNLYKFIKNLFKILI